MATTSHIDYRKIDYDQVLHQPIIHTNAEMDTITEAWVYDKGDWKRYIVSVNEQTITQTIEEKNGYRERYSTDGWTTWSDRDIVLFSDANHKWDKVIISENEPIAPIETTAWLNLTDDSFNIYDWEEWHTISGSGHSDIPVLPTFSWTINGTSTTFQNASVQRGDGILIIGVTSWTAAGIWQWEVVQDGRRTLTSSETELSVGFKYIIIKENGYPFSTDASNILYDNIASGLQSNNVQDAIDEIQNNVEIIENNITTINETLEEIQTIVEATEMEEPSAENVGSIIQYKGETTAGYVQGYFYKSVEVTPGEYEWQQINVQPETVIDELNDIGDVTITNPTDWQVLKHFQWSWINSDDIDTTIQTETMPTASSQYLWRIFQYVWTTTQDYTNGYFYKCVGEWDPAVYSRINIDVQKKGSTSMYISPEDYALLTPEEKNDPNIDYFIRISN